MRATDLDKHEPVIRHTIGALTEMMPEAERPAAARFLLQVLHEDPHIAHITLPICAHLIKTNRDWQVHLEVAHLITCCRPRAWVSRMLASIPNEGADVQAEFLVGVAHEIEGKFFPND